MLDLNGIFVPYVQEMDAEVEGQMDEWLLVLVERTSESGETIQKQKNLSPGQLALIRKIAGRVVTNREVKEGLTRMVLADTPLVEYRTDRKGKSSGYHRKEG